MDSVDDHVSIKKIVLTPLSEYGILIEKFLELLNHASLLPSIAKKNNVIESLENIFEQLIHKDRELHTAVKKLKEHQSYQRQIEQLQQGIDKQDKAIIRYARALREGQKNIDKIFEKHRHTLKSIDTSKVINEVNPQDIVAYAHRIAGTTSAQPYWKPGLPMFGFMPPAPQEQMMRAGVLSRGVLEETATEVNVSSWEEKENYQPKSFDETRNLDNIPVMLNSGEDVKKQMPPGWKPGDKIVLPNSVVIPSSAQEVIKKHQLEIPNGVVKSGDPIAVEEINKKRKMDFAEDEDESESESSSSESDNNGIPTISLHMMSSSDEDEDSD